MGIKTKFNPMGGGNNEKGKLSDWRYSTASNGQITLYEYLGQYSSTKPVYVPKKGGKIVINDYTSGTTTTASNTPFYENQNVISVDLQNVPFVNNSMINAFSNCQNLVSVNNINPNTVRMLYTFKNCHNLNQNVQIPNSVQDMQRTFYNCYNLNQNIKLSSSATVLAYTFFRCSKLNQNIQIPSSALHVPYLFRDCRNLDQNISIPDSVINTCGTFYNCFKLNQNISLSNASTTTQFTFYRCYNLNQNIRIPNSVTTTMAMFQYCYNLNQNIQIPNSVTNMVGTFSHCNNLDQDIQIPRSVTNMNDVFDGCTNLQGNITILPSEVTDANYLFYGCGLSKNVIFPLRYINNVNTVTRNTLVTAATGGYAVGTAVGNLVNNTAQNALFYAYDPIAWEGYNAWTGNGTHWQLEKWAGIGKNPALEDITVPNSITSYATFPTSMNYQVFAGNTVINSVYLPDNIPWATQPGNYKDSKSLYGAFRGCTNLKRVDALMNSSVTIVDMMFDQATALQVANIRFQEGITRMTGTFRNCQSLSSYTHPIPTSCSNIQALFERTNLSQDSITIPNAVTQMAWLFATCDVVPKNIYITSPLVANIVNTFVSRNNTRMANLYLPYLYDNGVYTATYGQFNANAIYKHNATSNLYMYDSSPYNSVADYVITVTSPNLYLNTYRGQSATPTTVATSPFAGNTVYLLPSTYTANATLTYVDCNNVPFAGTTVLGAFKSCLALQGVNNINVPSGVTTAQNMFYDCRELRSVNVKLPTSCTTATTMFINCKNCSDFVLDAPGLTTMTNCFDACNSQPLNITLTSPNISTITNMFRRAVTAHRKNIYIYYKYSNGAFTTTYTKMNIAQYAGTSGLSNSTSPKYNSKGNYYVYDLTAKYQDTNVANILNGFTYTQSGSTYNLTKYAGEAYAKVPKKEQVKLYPDSTSTMTYGVDTIIYNNCFNNTSSLVSVDLQNVPFVSNNMYAAFFNCRNLTFVTGINQNVTSMAATFSYCNNLNQNIQIPNSVTSMAGTFAECHILNQNIQIPNSVTNMVNTFKSCYSINQSIIIPNSVTNMASTFESCYGLEGTIILSNRVANASSCFYGTSKAKNVYIPFKYSNGVNSATFNSFVTAGYLYANGVSNNQHGVTVHDLNS